MELRFIVAPIFSKNVSLRKALGVIRIFKTNKLKNVFTALIFGMILGLTVPESTQVLANNEITPKAPITNINVTLPQSVDAVFPSNTTNGNFSEFTIKNNNNNAKIQIQSVYSKNKTDLMPDINLSTNGYLNRSANFANLGKKYQNNFSMLISDKKMTTAEAYADSTTYDMAKHTTDDKTFGTAFRNTLIDKSGSSTFYLYGRKGVSTSSQIGSHVNDVVVTVDLFEKEYNIKYDVNGGQMPALYPTTYISIKGTKLPVPIKQNAQFLGWREKVPGEQSHTEYITEIMPGETGDKEYIAVYKEPGILVTGEQFNSKLKQISENATELIFTKTAIPDNKKQNSVLVSVSGGNIWMYKDNNTIFVSPEVDDAQIFANALSESMFNSGNNNEIHNLERIRFDNFDTSKVVTMKELFSNCSKLKEIVGLDKFNTSNVVTMMQMFNNCKNLTSLDVSFFDTSHVTSMYSIVAGCSSLTELNLSKFNTSQVTSMYNTFSGCSSLISLDLSNWNTSNVDSMNYMFNQCTSLQNLNISNFNTTKVTDMSLMFNGLSSLKTLDLSSFDISNVTNIYNMFENCSLLSAELTVQCTDITYIAYAFNNTSTASNARFIIKYIDAQTKEMAKKLVATKSSNSHVYLMSHDIIFDAGEGTVSTPTKEVMVDEKYGDLPTPTRTGYTFTGWYTAATGGTLVTKDSIVKACDEERLYARWTLIGYTITYNLNSGSISGQKTSYNIETPTFTLPTPTRSGYIFTGWTGTGLSSATKTVTISKGSTGNRSYTANWQQIVHADLIPGNDFSMKIYQVGPKATSIVFGYKAVPGGVTPTVVSTSSSPMKAYMFLSGSTIYVTPEKENGELYANSDSNGMLSGYAGGMNELQLTKADVGKLNMSNATMINGMFSSGKYTEIIGLNKWNTSKITMMNATFVANKNLKTLDLSGWDTSKVTLFATMFNECSSLTTITGIDKWNVSSATDISMMFTNCSSLTSLNLSGWNTAKVTNYMSAFSRCAKLNGSITVGNANVLEYGMYGVFENTSTASGTKFTVNYKAGCQSIAQKLVATKSSNSNVVLGSQK